MAYTTIDDPSAYFQTKIYTGTGSSQAYTFDGNSDMQPDFLWFKQRSEEREHRLYDSVRGVTKYLEAHQDGAESTDSGATGLTALGSDGFTVVSANGVNAGSSRTYVAWGWKAGGSASTNENGSITSSVSANQDVGFSIVSYTGNATDDATVGHGLSSAPQMVITKSRGDAGAWQVLTNITSDYSEGDYIALNTTDAVGNSANVSFVPTSTTWQMKSGQAGNTSSTKIAYCFHSVQGYSKFGNYTGNGNVNGTFVYTGFKPAWVIVKKTSATNNWVMMDNKRDPFNMMTKYLLANDNTAEGTGLNFDFLSNGFKLKSNSGGTNTSGATYIYMAFAENPFVSSTGVPATAR